MEGDIKDIVLGRLEQRLKEKDEEIRSLKKEIEASSGSGGEIKALAEKVDHLEMEVKEAQITLSEVLRKMGALEETLNTVLMAISRENEEGYPEEDLSIPGSVPIDPQLMDKFAASDQKDIKEDGHKDAALRFFHLSRNS